MKSFPGLARRDLYDRADGFIVCEMDFRLISVNGAQEPHWDVPKTILSEKFFDLGEAKRRLNTIVRENVPTRFFAVLAILEVDD